MTISNITDKFKEHHYELYEKATEKSKFLNDLAGGKISEKCFQYFLAQDCHFVMKQVQFLGYILRLVPCSEDCNEHEYDKTERLMAGITNAIHTTVKDEIPFSPADAEKPLFKHQSKIPFLPVPELSSTLKKYLRSVRAIANDEEYANTVKAVETFRQPGGMGDKLQARLQERAATHLTDWSEAIIVADKDINGIGKPAKSKTSWLYDWWRVHGYMAYRDPVIIYVSPFFVLSDVPRLVNKPARRAAETIQATLRFRKLINTGMLETEMVKTSPLSMDPYMWMFNSCRIPVIPSDMTRVTDPAIHNHIIVVRQGRFFRLDLPSSISTEQIEGQLLKIYEMADKSKADVPVGILTSDNRDNWTKARTDLLNASIKNQASIEDIETAAFLVSLEAETPSNIYESIRGVWHGDGKNRWFDIPIQWVVFDSGRLGLLMEHSMLDGMPTSTMTEYICERMVKNDLDHGVSREPHQASKLPPPKHLEFDITPSLQQHINTAQTNFDKLISTHTFRQVLFSEYGRDHIKKMGVPPDAYAQLAMQLAYYKTHGKCRGTYESVQTRQFQYGRTETCRSCSVDSANWCKAMSDASVDVNVKSELGRLAAKTHQTNASDGAMAQGLDRHLFGLKLLVDSSETMPSIFSDPMFDETRTWYMSTSTLDHPYVEQIGFGEVTPTGYGICYHVKPRDLRFGVGCKAEMKPEVFEENLKAALREMKEVFTASVPANPSRL
ncbi:hypothetical protein SmJEL517_g00675 [Synchytrium microbalum]|uniref:Carnitine O-acetyltransferase, mitochondrial n=1 Tax=Synchytrium microbalum TaxID=1806994 RepID=A0A507CDJ2_9FUNG|nr:uncharacterized protein SmJEL517_g00675 [Synchytrium microbalum]TPX37571.1 hypothetical protein SmJEL517_g00675 [Synchytrium microbalum]